MAGTLRLAGRWGIRRRYLKIAAGRGMVLPEKEAIRACCPHVPGDRARLNALEGPSSLIAGQAWKKQPGGMSL